jgi:hypothetical protein
LYGIAELAAALGVDRYKIAMWRKRGNRGIPNADHELAMGPVWLESTVRPWLRAVRKALKAEAAT